MSRACAVCALALGAVLVLAAPAAAAEEPDPAALLGEARELLLDDDAHAAVANYERVLALPVPSLHPEALEYLGVAERMRGDPAAASARFRKYLARFPQDPGAPRVRQRLVAIEGLVPPAAAPLREPRRFAIHGDLTQELWYDSFDNDQADAAVARSYLLSYASFGFEHRGERYDLGGRVDAGYQRMLQSDGPSGDDQGQVANAYLQVIDAERDWQLRLGRQTSGSRGLLGRFDGAALAVGLLPRLSLRADVGWLVETTRHLADAQRPFAGVSLALEDVAELLDVTLFGTVQRNDSLPDREALGLELRLGGERLALSGVVDYDVSYEALNLAQLVASASLGERLQVHGRVSAHAAPLLTTTNALIGQPVATLGDLEETYREAQLRTIARNRTSDVLTAAVGMRTVLSQRWYLNADASVTRFDGTVASAGVTAIPESQQTYLSLDLIGASIFRSRDSVLLGYRFDRSEAADTHSVRVDLRLPLGRAVEVSPMLSAAWRDLYRHGDEELVFSPGLRVSFHMRERVALELEGRGNWSLRHAPDEPRGPLSLREDEEVREYLLKASVRVDL